MPATIPEILVPKAAYATIDEANFGNRKLIFDFYGK